MGSMGGASRRGARRRRHSALASEPTWILSVGGVFECRMGCRRSVRVCAARQKKLAGLKSNHHRRRLEWLSTMTRSLVTSTGAAVGGIKQERHRGLAALLAPRTHRGNSARASACTLPNVLYNLTIFLTGRDCAAAVAGAARHVMMRI